MKNVFRPVFGLLAVVTERPNQLELKSPLSGNYEIALLPVVRIISRCSGAVDIRPDLLQMQDCAADGLFLGRRADPGTIHTVSESALRSGTVYGLKGRRKVRNGIGKLKQDSARLSLTPDLG